MMFRKSMLLVVMSCFLLSVSMATASEVMRTISPSGVNAGETVVVELDVSVTGGEEAYAMEENFPVSFAIIDDGNGSVNESGQNKWIKWVVCGECDFVDGFGQCWVGSDVCDCCLETVDNTTYTYQLQAPSTTGNYSISGVYMFEDMENEDSISGDDQVTVTGTSEPSTDDDGDDGNGGSTGGGGAGCTSGSNRTCSGDGICQPAYQTCSEGVWGECIGSRDPSPETCNGIDDDCDGKIDNEADCCTNGETRACGPSTELGECTKGIITCSGGTWSTECVGAVYPAIETCGDGKDNDCDGETDEDCDAPQCSEGQITGTCICENSARNNGYCCAGIYLEDGCVDFPSATFIIAGVLMLVVLYAALLIKSIMKRRSAPGNSLS